MYYFILRMILAIILGNTLRKSGITIDNWQFWAILATYLTSNLLVRAETLDRSNKK